MFYPPDNDRLKGPPEGWTHPRAFLREFDTSKVPRYRLDLGFEFWTDIVERGVTTSDPGIHFRWRVFWGRDIKFSYGELVVDGKMITLTNREG